MKFEIGLSMRAYAKRRGCDPKAVRKAVGTEGSPGRIWEARFPDGTIDPDKADRLWEANTDPSQRRGKEAARAAAAMRGREESQASPSQEGCTADVAEPDADGEDVEPEPAPAPRPREAFEEDPPRRRPAMPVGDVEDRLQSHMRGNRAGEDEEDEDGGEFSDNPTMLALALKEKAQKVRKLTLANDKEERLLVARAPTWNHFTAVVRGMTEAYGTWPEELGPALAGHFGLDSFAVTQFLKDAMREKQTRMAKRDAPVPLSLQATG